MLTGVNIQYRVHISLNDGTDLHSFLYVSPSLPQTGSLLLEHLLIFLLLQFSIKLSLLHTLRCSKIISSSITSRGTQLAPPPQQLQAQPVLKSFSRIPFLIIPAYSQVCVENCVGNLQMRSCH